MDMTSSVKSLTDCRPGKDLATKIAHAMLGECPNNLANFVTNVHVLHKAGLTCISTAFCTEISAYGIS